MGTRSLWQIGFGDAGRRHGVVGDVLAAFGLVCSVEITQIKSGDGGEAAGIDSKLCAGIQKEKGVFRSGRVTESFPNGF